VAAHSGLPAGRPWWALAAQALGAVASSRLALWNQPEAAVPQSAERSAVAQPEPLELRIE
jgi:hypothetical protein